MKTTKNLLGLITFGILLLGSYSSFAQEDENKTVHLKIEKNVNGEKTVIDTIIHTGNENDMIFFENGEGEAENVHIFINEDIEKEVVIEGDSIKMDIKMVITDDDEKKETIWHTYEVEGELEGGEKQVFVIGHDDNRPPKKNDKNVKEGENIVIIKKEIVVDRDDEMQNIKVIVEGEDDENIEKKIVIISNDDKDKYKVITPEYEEMTIYQTDDKTTVIITNVKIENFDENEQKTLESVGISNENDLDIEEFKFYPNPNDGKFTLDFNLPIKGLTSIKIYDLSGKEIYSNDLGKFSGLHSENIDISGEAEGIYFLQIKQDRKTINRKIILK